MAPKLDKEEARQAEDRTMPKRTLAVSLALAIAAMAVVYVTFA